MTTENRPIDLGRLIPILIAVAFTIDVGGRFLPLKWFTERAWEAATRYPLWSGPFTPGFRYENPSVNSDLPRLGNLPYRDEARREVFTTDSEGFRRGERIPSRYTSMVIGDSLTVGLGERDDETLSSDIDRLGGGCLNAGWMEVKTQNVVRQADRIGMAQGTVIYVYMERQPLRTVRDVSGVTSAHRYRRTDPWSYGKARQVWRNSRAGFLSTTPIGVLAQRAYKLVQNDGILPNPFRREVAERRLPDGRRVLFYAPDVGMDKSRSDVDVSGLATMSDGLAARGLHFVVVLLPTKYTAFRPLVESDGGANPGEIYLERLEHALKDHGVDVLNMAPAFISACRRGFEKDQPIYFMDDTHWNTRGIRFMRDALVAHGALRPVATPDAVDQSTVPLKP